MGLFTVSRDLGTLTPTLCLLSDTLRKGHYSHFQSKPQVRLERQQVWGPCLKPSDVQEALGFASRSSSLLPLLCLGGQAFHAPQFPGIKSWSTDQVFHGLVQTCLGTQDSRSLEAGDNVPRSRRDMRREIGVMADMGRLCGAVDGGRGWGHAYGQMDSV